MPLNDSDPYLRFRMTSEELDRLRRGFIDKGKEIWHAATRTGANVIARTESELAELGRAHLEREALQRQQDGAGSQAAAAGLRTGARLAQQGLNVVNKQARAVARTVVDPLKRAHAPVVEAVAGTPADPKPVRVVTEWALGSGPEHRMLGPDSAFSQEFARAPSVRAHVRNAINHPTEGWRSRPGGWDAQGGAYVDYEADFYPDFVKDVVPLNSASQAIGSYALDGRRIGDQIDWQARNRMGRNSLNFGHALGDMGLSGVPDMARPGPTGNTYQTIHFRTDLKGNPIPPPRRR
jgi:hypothetical protein